MLPKVRCLLPRVSEPQDTPDASARKARARETLSSQVEAEAILVQSDSKLELLAGQEILNPLCTVPVWRPMCVFRC